MLFYYDQEDHFLFALEQWFSLNLQQNGVFSMGLCCTAITHFVLMSVLKL